MAGPPILDECRVLLTELDRVEKSVSRLTGEMVESAVGEVVGENTPIEGIVDAHSQAQEEFAALRARIVDLGRSYGLCPQHVPEEGYSAGRLRGLLQSIQSAEQRFKQPAPEPLGAPWENIPNDLLDSLEAPVREAAAQATDFREGGERLPSDVERFLDRVISEADRAVLAETRDPGAITASPLAASVPERQTPPRPRQKSAAPPALAPTLSQDIPPQPPTEHSQVPDSPKRASPVADAAPVDSVPVEKQAEKEPEREKPAAPPEAKAPPVEAAAPSPAPLPKAEAPPIEASIPSFMSVSLPPDVGESVAAAEDQLQQEAPTRNWEPTSMASDRDYQDLLEYGEGKLGLGRAEFADLLANLALLNHKQGRFEDSEELHRKELMIRENEFGPDHPKVATSLNNLALLFRDLGRYDEARALWQRSLAIVEKAFGPDHPKVALRLGNLADLLQDSGETAAAERHYGRLLKLRETGSVVKKREVKSSLRKYAKLLRSSRRKKDARRVEAQTITGGPRWFQKWK